VKSLCRTMSVRLEAVAASPVMKPSRATRIRRLMPHPIHGILALVRNLLAHAPFRRGSRAHRTSDERSILIFSYLGNVDVQAAADGEFCSQYWQALHAKLRRLGWTPNCLHLFAPCPAVPNADAAAALARRFNAAASFNGSHEFVHAYLTW